MNPSVNQFALTAQSYCTWAESGQLKPESVASEALLHLAKLYCEALNLPSRYANTDAPKISYEDWKNVFNHFSVLPVNYYSVCFDPLTAAFKEEPVVGDLADDLADIWRDLKGGLFLFNAGQLDAAVWEWHFNFKIHWGNHATSAMYVLQKCLSKTAQDT